MLFCFLGDVFIILTFMERTFISGKIDGNLDAFVGFSAWEFFGG
jgi:hypothetical protein